MALAPVRAVAGAQRQLLRAMSSKAPVPVEDVGRMTSEDGVTILFPAQAFKGDMRSTSGLGFGDNLQTHTDKWLNGSAKSPMQYIQDAPPIKVHGLTVASTGSDDPALGAPVEYICLKGSTKEHPAVCKYTGNKYYSDDWIGGGAH